MGKREFFLLGDPVEHSLSPSLHHHFYQSFSLEDHHYLLQRVDREGFCQALLTFARSGSFAGANVTVPHKLLAFESCDEVVGDAQLLGAVNTLKRKEGRWFGYNTDAKGWFYSWEDRFPQEPLGDKRVLVLGAGGASRSVILACLEAGVKDLRIFNRSKERLLSLKKELKELWSRYEVEPCFEVGLEGWHRHACEGVVVIQTTSLGISSEGSFSWEWPKNCQGFACDINYKPYHTPFLEEAKKRGWEILPGMGMLAFQGLFALELWLEKTLEKSFVKAWLELEYERFLQTRS